LWLAVAVAGVMVVPAVAVVAAAVAAYEREVLL
jgi:hypothetical protein